ncbi:MAG TPA: asparagine synthase (glutamine-hydrolyzing) [Candidatus Deferrimicrobiaceae bacterium]|jgi:asparagine synthase (glutamine-hydrolysing)
MCGIFGVVYADPAREAEPALLERMAAVLHHRGPDHTGVWTRGNVGLGHTRLSIIDLSPSGAQPMTNEDGSVRVTFNGEIYNYRELRKWLVGRGHAFRSNTDTEVLVHLWEEHGPSCVDSLRGMFAFAVWDDRRKALFLARDRAGKKPLFYAALPDRFLFASEIKAILQDPAFRAEPDIASIHHYLAYQSVPAPYCAFKGIRKLSPAHRLLIRGNAGTPERYWKLSYADKIRVEGEKGLASLREEIVERLRESVRIRLMSDVPLGAFLSGGLDSSLVTALMAGLTNAPVKTFSIGFDEPEYDELPYARMVAKRYGTEHHEFVVRPDARSIFPELVWHYNEPFADSSAIPTWYVCKLARRHVTVVLNGDGGDENFAGYPRYGNEGDYALRGGLRAALSGWFGPRGKLALFSGPASRMGETVRRLSALTQRRLLYYRRITHFSEYYKADLYTPEMKTATRGLFSVDLMLDRYRAAAGADFLDATMGLDFDQYLPDTLMPKVDIASMAHSLEARSPFLDHEFMEFAARIPSGLKLADGVGKRILKAASEPLLPHEVIYRKKMGFGVPVDHWFRNELKDMTRDILLSPRATSRGYFRKAYVESMLDRHQRGENWQYLIWNLLMLEMWHLMFIDRTMSPPVAGTP